MGALISVVSENDPTVVAEAIFNGPGVTVQGASWIAIAEADSSPAGTFTNGPYGIGSGGILTNGLATRAGDSFIGDEPNTNNVFPGSEEYCGSQTFDATILEVRIEIGDVYEGVEVEFILSSMEYTEGRPDPIGIYLDGTLWSIDDSNQRITATSEYLNGEIGINELDKVEFDFGNGDEINRATRYDGSSPPLLIGIPAVPGEHTMIFAICDSTDGNFDSGLMVKAKGCKDCDPQVRINYVSTTTTTGSTSFTSTTKAIGTESGTVLFGVPAEETTTTTEDVTTTSTAASTTDESSATATTTESQESSTATSGIVTDTTTQTLDQSSIATSTLGTTTEESSILETSTATTATHDSSSTRESLMETDTTGAEPIPASETISTTYELSTTVLPKTTSTEGIDTQTPSGETTQPSLSDTTSVEDVQSTRSIKQSNSLTPIVPDSTSSALSPTETVSPTNLEVIGDFTFLGCLGSPDGYPSFDLVATSDDMTPSKCVSLTTDRLYVGIYDRSCYASDSLESTSLVGEGQCNTPCRNAPLLFCGGLVGAGGTNDALQRRSRFRRDAPSDVLLTLYGASDVGDSSSSALVTGPPATMSTSEIIGESVSTIEPVTSESIRGVITSGQAVPFPPNRPVPTGGWLGKNNMTQAANPVITVSTITYTIIDPQNPSTFKVEEYCSTIEYYPCHRCEHQDIPAVHMTTIQRQCNACGVNGENSVYLTLPAAVAAPSATDKFKHVDNSPQHGSEPFVASPVETGFHHPKPIIQAKPTKAHYNPLPPVSVEDDVPVRLNDNQPQVHPEDDFPEKPQVEAPKAPINEPRPVDQAHPTSQFVGGYEIKTTTLPTWNVPSEVPVIVSTATMSFPIFGTIFLVFTFASLLNSM
ncbi:uncharacterized protein B0J16DRAFT_399835 [Fusarium flagelliforme]|uniref:uncharacterized protein n=1 Tax=Fusarium flagelliforme TaxID=2675880 RepID=UPI001E8D4C2E|nr:uncharacterized protein B0J16DRAFT_399835 [Fusarium flagelliforme]KAH7185980.1 hypothetical protein B0J16DRAFT_399835 [Fusarium flagelliforme]